MKSSIKMATAIILSILLQAEAQAQKSRKKDVVLTAHGWYGTDVERTRPNLKTYGYTTYEAGIGLQTTPKESSAFARQFGYPILSIGLSLARMGEFEFYDQTALPDLYSLYTSFERSLWRRKRCSLGYLLNLGVTYNPGRYDPVNHPGNNWLSYPAMAYFGAGAFAKLHLTRRWEIGGDVMFRHFSNGRLALPNEALNAMGAGVFARYRLNDYDYKEYTGRPHLKGDYKRGMRYILVLGGGVHTCMAEWNAKVETEDDPAKKSEIKLKAHPKLSVSIDAVYRYALRYASGASIDIFYSSNMKELEASDRIVYGDDAVDNSPGYAPFSLGISLVHEVYWHNLALHIAVGAYPYRHKGVNGFEAKKAGDRERGWHYEKAGLRYYFPKLGDTFLGLAIKSHSIKAEYLEFSAGIRL